MLRALVAITVTSGVTVAVASGYWIRLVPSSVLVEAVEHTGVSHAAQRASAELRRRIRDGALPKALTSRALDVCAYAGASPRMRVAVLPVGGSDSHFMRVSINVGSVSGLGLRILQSRSDVYLNERLMHSGTPGDVLTIAGCFNMLIPRDIHGTCAVRYCGVFVAVNDNGDAIHAWTVDEQASVEVP